MPDYQSSRHAVSPGVQPNSPESDLPTSGADRNQRSLAGDAAVPAEETFLPSLDPGITVLDIDGGRGVPVIHALVLDHLLLADGPAFWVDAHGYATTTTLARVSPSRRLLDRIQVTRGFTPYQHYSAIRDLPAAVTTYIERAGSHQETQVNGGSARPSLIVTPAVDVQYRDDGTALARENAETLQARALTCLSRYARAYEIPVLVTRTRVDQFTTPIEQVADQTLQCEQTRMGPRFSSEEFETVVYPVADGAYYQTTFAYWQRILAARVDQRGLDLDSAPTPGSSEAALGEDSSHRQSGATRGDALTPTPLLDAWRNGSTTRRSGG